MTLKRNVVTGEIVDIPDPDQVGYDDEAEARSRARRRLTALGRLLLKPFRREALESRGARLEQERSSTQDESATQRVEANVSRPTSQEEPRKAEPHGQ